MSARRRHSDGRSGRQRAILALIPAALGFLALPSACTSPARRAESAVQNCESLLTAGEYEKALRSAERGARRFAALPEMQAKLLIAQASALLSLGRAQEAAAVLAKVRSHDIAVNARVQMHRGYAHVLRGQFHEAEAALADALRDARLAADEVLQAEVEIRRGTMLAQTGRAEEAELIFRQALETGRRLQRPNLEAAAVGNLGVLALRASMYEEALYWLEQSRSISERLQAPASAAKAIGNLGWCYFKLGDLDTAAGMMSDAASRYAQVGNALEQQIWIGNVASVLAARGDYASAREKYLEAVELARRLDDRASESQWLSNLASVAIELKDWDSAETYNKEADAIKVALSRHAARVYSRLNEARIFLGRGDAEKAAGIFRNVAAESPSDPVLQLDARVGLAGSLSRLGKHGPAGQEFASLVKQVNFVAGSVDAVERRAGYFGSLVRFYQQYVEYLMSRGQAWEALEVAEMSRARLLDGGVAKLAAPKELRMMAARSGVTFLEYWLGPRQSYVWTIDAEGLKSAVMPGEPVLRDWVSDHQARLMALRNPLEVETPVSRKLYDVLFGLLRGTKNDRLLIVPDRILHSLAWDTLTRDGEYALDRYEISVAPALRLLRMSKAPDSVRTAMLIGEIGRVTEEYPPLRYSAQELQSVESSLSDWERESVTGLIATPERVRAAAKSRWGILHFSVHAVSAVDNPLDSALVLSKGAGGYRLSARDIVKCGLSAGLVTVSACQSAGVRSYAGEGMMGLTWAFLRAGSRSVIAGLWDVNDKSTAELMGRTYRMFGKGMPVGRALRRAKQQMAHGSSPGQLPYYWGAFQVYRRSL